MVGITRFARYAGLAGLPAILPAFAKAAWLGIVPEFNPFKYNSFPVNGARQSHRLTRAVQQRIARYARAGKLGELPPILTFQSLIDFTVSTRAIVAALYGYLPANNSELVLFDVNRTARLGPLLRPSTDTVLARIIPSAPRRYRLAVITNANDESASVIERATEADSDVETSRPLGLSYPPAFYSLSHVALPFPLSDALYGIQPDPSENFGENLGALMPRGERNVLIASLDSLMRASSNPFFPYMIDRIGEGIPAAAERPVQ
jgi:alpha-beta hydrolase superfamily lysophospholipase